MSSPTRFLYGAPFDPSKAIFRKTPPTKFFDAETTIPLKQALARGDLTPDTMLQGIEIDGQAFVFITRELLVYDVAQGGTEAAPWIVTFCPICNSGAAFSARLDGRTLHFAAGGIYNAMAILKDEETGSYWDHIHGNSLFGAMEGKRLTRLGTLRHIQATDALIAYANPQFASANLDDAEQTEAREDDKWRTADEPEWSARFVGTLLPEDTRLPRLNMGLGVWTDSRARYYPVSTLNIADNVLLTEFEGRRLLVYVNWQTSIPDAFYTTATSAQWRGEVLILNTGELLINGTLQERDGTLIPVERPLQLFQRWYGFSAMFPDCEVATVPKP